MARRRMALELACLAVLLVILVAGLWPFHAPRNAVTWVKGENGRNFGLHFGKYSVAMSGRPFAFTPTPEATSPCSLEIWIQPDFVDHGGTILAFYTPETQTIGFSLHQSLDDLLLRRATSHGNRAQANLYVGKLFRQSKRPFITITSGTQGTVIYLNGVQMASSSRFGLSNKDLTGQLVLGNPLTRDSWQGELSGLAIYDRELAPDEVARHYDAWDSDRKADIAESRPFALYAFNEKVGNIVHNQTGPGPDLDIPERFTVLHASLLASPWDEYQPGWSYWKNVLINIGGFVPFGFLFCAYLASARSLRQAAITTILMGGLLSLTIEILQAFLPTRDSGATDIITNTLGTGMGAVVYSVVRGHCQTLFSRSGQ